MCKLNAFANSSFLWFLYIFVMENDSDVDDDIIYNFTLTHMQTRTRPSSFHSKHAVITFHCELVDS